ncbi:hypothetical protein HPB50_012667 [Hyalomma asiaticum]|uniref:Uncharacterized protein n=1 Tax=Hyalomma asiaticum TaxID=266040 RepID=A0ACB7TLN6_HYAAI|nr:hypothetical protein HPB50_012667 [Hyalomma asiaticum]
MHRKYRVTHSASLSYGYVHALVSFTRTTIHVVPCAPPHRRPVFRLSQPGFRPGLRRGDVVGTSKRHSHRRAFRPRKPQQLMAAAEGPRSPSRSVDDQKASCG